MGGHFNNAFGSYHAAYVSQFEEIMMAIDPSIEGLPYWDATWDCVDRNNYFGSATGTGKNGEVEDGRFAFFPIKSNFSIHEYRRYMKKVSSTLNAYTGSI